MKQTPTHEVHNPDLLALMPKDASRVVEVGCSTGALAQEYRKVNSQCHYTGIEIDAEYAKLAERYCDAVMVLDILNIDHEFLNTKLVSDCWVFSDSLEHLRDPWRLLASLRKVIPKAAVSLPAYPMRSIGAFRLDWVSENSGMRSLVYLIRPT